MSLTKWRIYCITENSWTEGWLESGHTPTTCFRNNEHNVNPSSLQDIETTQKILVHIEQEAIATGGNYKTDGFAFTAAPNTTTIFPTTWPIPITTSVVHILDTVENLDDTLDAIVAPQTPVGVITAEHQIGCHIVSTNSTVFAHAKVGYECFVGMEFLGRILELNPSTLTIRFQNPTTVVHAAGEYFSIQLRIIQNYPLGTKIGGNLGVASIGGKWLPANTITNVIYTNNSNVAKKFRFTVEHLF
jgi:hypothetical protein